MKSTRKNPKPTLKQPATRTTKKTSPFGKAFNETAKERAALTTEQLVHLNFEPTLAIEMVLAALPRIESLKDDIASLPRLDHGLLARLEQYANAAGHAHGLYVVAVVQPEELKRAYEDALARRAILYSDAVNLARHGLVNLDAVNAIGNEVGFRNVGYDLIGLVSLLREAESRVAGRSATLPADWDAADVIAADLLGLAARRETRRQQQPKLADDRLRAITLMVKSYDQTRRAVQFLRHDEGDADLITPSLYTARAARRRDETVAPVDSATVTPGPTQPTQNAATVSPQMAQPEAVVPGALGGNPYL
jgi:hypothetical protein